ncbi:hypothetical protein MYX64_08170, partial [Nitrospinae bacterium AH_259_B05_G02_I21]|nr:hypothetical protein [Nitrospinae bacterium AH_259_B05_G02_I21]
FDATVEQRLPPHRILWAAPWNCLIKNGLSAETIREELIPDWDLTARTGSSSQLPVPIGPKLVYGHRPWLAYEGQTE